MGSDGWSRFERAISCPIDAQPNYHFVIAEIGINHNGSVDRALELVQLAAEAGCDAVKFQKRHPSLCTPYAMRDQLRETPWGQMSYLEYKERLELDRSAYEAISELSNRLGISWSASAWDRASLEFLDNFDVPFHKIASALSIEPAFAELVASRGKLTFASTGFSTDKQIDDLVQIFERHKCPLILMHSVPTYPCPPKELNLSRIRLLRERYQRHIAYSGHEAGVSPTLIAASLGAIAVERHFTKSRSEWGTDQAASLEFAGMRSLVGSLRNLPDFYGTGDLMTNESTTKKLASLRAPSEAFL